MITLIDLSCLYKWKANYETETKKKEITALNFPNRKTNKKDIIMNTSSAPTSDRQITNTPSINNRCKPASIAKTRWVAYAAAGAATALAGSQSAEAAIHYSGRVNELFLVGDADSFRAQSAWRFLSVIAHLDKWSWKPRRRLFDFRNRFGRL